MARLAAWEFVAAADSAQAALDKGKGRARDDDDDGAEEMDAGSGGPASAWDGWHGGSTSADLGTTRSVSLPALDTAARFSVGSDRLSTIAFAGPALAPAPLARPPLLAAEATGSRYSIPYHLSPILETDTAPSSDVGCLDATTSSHGPGVAPESTTARPVLHIDPFRRPTRMHSDMSMSVYSRQSFAAPDHDEDDHDAGGGASEWGEELRSYFSPDTPAPRSLSLGGLAIRGATAESMPRPTPTSLLEGEVVFDPLPAPSLPSQIALSARPSFSAFAFPSTSSLATSSSSERASRVASPLFDEAHGPAAVSTVTVATSVFETVDDSEDGRSTHGKELHPSESGGWRTGWGWDMFPRPEPATVRVPPVESGEPCAPTAMGPPVIVNPSSPTSPTLPRHSVAPAPPAAPAPIPATSRALASSSVRSPVLLPLAARALRKREKSLPSIPDNASMWSGVVAGAPIPHEEMHVEVFCTRELVRRTRDGEKRTVMERTLLFTEEA
ncbi:hypothetical protein DMC30DRAFT_389733 [Rhodotorula diobovata]|uniref:Proteophosphoglycan ppg4 n=1 Tax=Rhodotorula diobovata TaxID=5288 RepID=A0A5C5G495_9BASI|nr:hypothetical protein DMC30DRAFT_389733 [Rhodotorula diobovata]